MFATVTYSRRFGRGVPVAGLSLAQCAGHEVDNKKEQSKEKRTPKQVRPNRGKSLFIHLGCSLIC